MILKWDPSKKDGNEENSTHKTCLEIIEQPHNSTAKEMLKIYCKLKL